MKKSFTIFILSVFIFTNILSGFTFVYSSDSNSFVQNIGDSVAVEGNKVTLISDVTLNDPLTVSDGEELVLLLNGHTITGADFKPVIIVNEGASLTIEGEGFIKAGFASWTEAYEGVGILVDGGSLVVDGGKIYGGPQWRGVGVYVKSGNLTVNDGEIYGGDTENIYCGGSGIYNENGDVVVNGGIITGGKSTYDSGTSYDISGGTGIINYSNLEINSGVISGGDAVNESINNVNPIPMGGWGIISFGDTVVNNGEIHNGNGMYEGENPPSNSVIDDYSAIVICSGNTVINGGIIKAKPTYDGCIVRHNAGSGIQVNRNAILTVNGGKVYGGDVYSDESYQGNGIYSEGTVYINGGEIYCGTLIGSDVDSYPSFGIFNINLNQPINFYSGKIIGGQSAAVNGEVSGGAVSYIYESDDDTEYTLLEDTQSDMKYLKAERIPEVKTPAEIVYDALILEEPDCCTLDVSSQSVTLTKDVQLTSELVIPEEGLVTLKLAGHTIYGAPGCDAISAYAVYILDGTVRGGDEENFEQEAGSAVVAKYLFADRVTFIGGDRYNEEGEYSSRDGVTAVDYWDGCIFSGEFICGEPGNEGEYDSTSFSDIYEYSVPLESDDGKEYSVMKDWYSDKKYIKISRPDTRLSSAKFMVEYLNLINPGCCEYVNDEVTLLKDITIEMFTPVSLRSDESVVFNAGIYDITLIDTCIQIAEGSDITIKGTGEISQVITAYGSGDSSSGSSSGSSGGTSGGSAGGASGGSSGNSSGSPSVGRVHGCVIENEGALTLDGIDIPSNADGCVSNGGTLVINGGVLTAAGEQPCISMSGDKLILNGGKFYGGIDTKGGQAINPGEEDNIVFNGGFIDGGEFNYAIRPRFTVRDTSRAYESDDNIEYTEIESGTQLRSYSRYMKAEYINPVPVTKITLDTKSIITSQDKIYIINAVCEPLYATNQDLIWESSDETVATVDNGVITAVAPGRAYITVTDNSGEVSDTCVVNVIKVTHVILPSLGGESYDINFDITRRLDETDGIIVAGLYDKVGRLKDILRLQLAETATIKFKDATDCEYVKVMWLNTKYGPLCESFVYNIDK